MSREACEACGGKRHAIQECWAVFEEYGVQTYRLERPQEEDSGDSDEEWTDADAAS